MKNIIEIRDLKKSYGDVKAVDGISFDVRKGSLFAFLGVNGAGKSTTINIICSILKKDSGKILVDGLDLDEKKEEIKSRIGVVFQNSTLDATLSVKDNLTIRAGFYGLKGQAWKKRLGELSNLLDLNSILSKPIKNLSGGQKRRVDIARGLINYPKILILDEPTTGLDPQTRLKIWELIDNLRVSQKMTVFLTTHYMEEANKADMVVMIDKGHVVASDTPHNLKNQFSSDYIKVYMKQNDAFEKAFQKFERNEKAAKKAEFLQKNSSSNSNAKGEDVKFAKTENENDVEFLENENDVEVAETENETKKEIDSQTENATKSNFEYDLQYCGEFYRINVRNSVHALEIINKFSNYIIDFEVLKGDMDDVFLNITGKNFVEHGTEHGANA